MKNTILEECLQDVPPPYRPFLHIAYLIGTIELYLGRVTFVDVVVASVRFLEIG